VNLAASAWEFRYRFWIFGAIFWISFYISHFSRTIFAQDCAVALSTVTRLPLTNNLVRAFLFVGVALSAMAAMLRTWATAYMRPEVMVDGALHTHVVVAAGPYRHVRNPLYLGTNILAVGYSLMASRAGAAMMILCIFVYHYRIILREERGLSADQGETYDEYRRAVPRLWPSLRPRVAASGLKPDWRGGLLGETFFWGLAVAYLVLALTLSWRAYFLALGLTFGVYFLSLGLIGAWRRRA
jgi:protein-S-isoprenylcysteine O-methyltransferase Ste14